MSDPGAIRYSVGGGVLTVSNGLMVFVAPAGPVADEWSELALAPATEAELAAVFVGEVPPEHYLAVVQLHDGGLALLCEPDGPRLSGRVERAPEGRIRFGMAPAASSSLWVGSGAVGASGFEIPGFGLAAAEPAPVSAPNPAATVIAEHDIEPAAEERGAEPRPLEGEPPSLAPATTVAESAMLHDDITVVDLPVPAPPPLAADAVSGSVAPPPPVVDPAADLDVPPPPPMSSDPSPFDPPRLDPPVLSTSLFPDLPIEPPAAVTPENPIIERTPTPPPPGIPVIDSVLKDPVPPSAEGRAVSLRFDDGQNIPLTSTMAIGRAPEGSEHAPPGCVVVVVAGDQVSRCHFLIRPTLHGAEVVDTNSLNGCFVDYPDRPGTGPQIPVGVPVPIEPGQQLRFGDRSLMVIDRT